MEATIDISQDFSLAVMLRTIEKDYPNLSIVEKQEKIKEIFGKTIKTIEIEKYYNAFEDFEKESNLQVSWLLL